MWRLLLGLRRVEWSAAHSTYLISLVVHDAAITAVDSVGSSNGALHRTCLHAIVINCLPDILVERIAVNAPRKGEEQHWRPV